MAASISPIVDYIKNRVDFKYSLSDPVFFEKKAAYSLDINNDGNVVERDVEIWIPNSDGSTLEVEFSPTSGSSLSGIKIRSEGKFQVLSLGDMRSGDTVSLSILKNFEFMSIKFKGGYTYPNFNEKVISKDRVAKFVAKENTVWYSEGREVALSLIAGILASISAALLFVLRHFKKD